MCPSSFSFPFPLPLPLPSSSISCELRGLEEEPEEEEEEEEREGLEEERLGSSGGLAEKATFFCGIAGRITRPNEGMLLRPL